MFRFTLVCHSQYYNYCVRFCVFLCVNHWVTDLITVPDRRHDWTGHQGLPGDRHQGHRPLGMGPHPSHSEGQGHSLNNVKEITLVILP